MGKLLIGPIIRHLLTALIAFFVFRRMISEDVARKLYTGDTIELWGGAWSINLKQIVDFLIGAWPIILPILISSWSRIVERFKLIVARCSKREISNAEVKEIVAETPITQIISTVAAKI